MGSSQAEGHSSAVRRQAQAGGGRRSLGQHGRRPRRCRRGPHARARGGSRRGARSRGSRRRRCSGPGRRAPRGRERPSSPGGRGRRGPPRSRGSWSSASRPGGRWASTRGSGGRRSWGRRAGGAFPPARTSMEVVPDGPCTVSRIPRPSGSRPSSWKSTSCWRSIATSSRPSPPSAGYLPQTHGVASRDHDPPVRASRHRRPSPPGPRARHRARGAGRPATDTLQALPSRT